MDAKEVASIVENALTGKHPAIRKSKVTLHENQLVLEIGKQVFLVKIQEVTPDKSVVDAMNRKRRKRKVKRTLK